MFCTRTAVATSTAETLNARILSGLTQTSTSRCRPPTISTLPTPLIDSISRLICLSAMSVTSRSERGAETAMRKTGVASVSSFWTMGTSAVSGRSLTMRSILLRTSCAATSAFFSSTKVIKTCETPSIEVERSSSIPLTVLTAPSTLSVISVSISCGEAPGLITVTVINPGASPQEIETEITDKVEGAVNTVSGIDELRSTSIEGVSQVFITFVLEKNADVAAQEVRNKIDLIVNDLPETAEVPIVQKLDTDATTVLRIAVSAPRSLREVTDIADKQIKRLIESINGVGNVEIVGGRQREVEVWVNPDKMRAFNVTAADVATAIKLQNMEVPGGRVEEGKRELTVRTMGRIPDPAQFNNLVVASRGPYAVKLSDIGYVEDGAEEQRTEARLNGQPAVTLVVSKQSGQNTVAVADDVKERLAEIAPTLPRDVKTQIVGDQTIFIKAALHSIQLHLIEGSILAAIVVFVFLWSLRSTFIAAIAIPTSIVATFGLMAAMGFTLNQITMLALTLMVGIVIDDAVVVLENIFRFIEEKGMPPFQAAIEGTREIGMAVTATTLSLLAVFLPVGFMAGIVGRFMSSFGFTSSFAIAV